MSSKYGNPKWGPDMAQITQTAAAAHAEQLERDRSVEHVEGMLQRFADKLSEIAKRNKT